MIDTVYQTLLTILSKDNQGYVTPTEFDRIAHLVQTQIFREYFEDENRDKIKQNRGLSNRGYSNLPFNTRQRITQFAETATITKTFGVYNLPADLYFIEDNGLSLSSNGNVVDEVERTALSFMMKSELSRPSLTYPVYEGFSDNVKVYPDTVTEGIICRYLRTPKEPKWTYFILPNGEVKFDPTNASFQDFELHESEFVNIVLKMLTHFGVAIRETEVVQVAETLKNEVKQNDNT